MTTTTLLADALPSSSIVANADEALAELAAQRQQATQRLDTLRDEQAALHQEQQTLLARRATIEQDAHLQARIVEQAELDAQLAAGSPIARASALEKLKDLRKGMKASGVVRQKELAHIQERQAAITARVEALHPEIAQEQAAISELERKAGMVQTSRAAAWASLGKETYNARAAKLDELQDHLHTLTQQFVEAQLVLREEKEATLLALGSWGELREEAIGRYDLLDDPMSRLIQAMIEVWNVLATETESSREFYLRVGQSYAPSVLELTRAEWETLLSANPLVRAQLIKNKRSQVEQLKLNYLVKH